MTENKPKQHGGRRPGAGRKPSLKPLAIIRLLDPDIRAALVALTVHQRQLSGNPQLSQEQVVADLIQATQHQLEKSDNQELPLPARPDALTTTQLENNNNQATLPLTHPTSAMTTELDYTNSQDSLPQTPATNPPTAELENTNNQVLPAQLAATAAAITTLHHAITALVATLRTKSAVGQRDGKRLITLLTELIDLHATQIAPWAILEELDRPHSDDTERDQALATLHQRPLAEYGMRQRFVHFRAILHNTFAATGFLAPTLAALSPQSFSFSVHRPA